MQAGIKKPHSLMYHPQNQTGISPSAYCGYLWNLTRGGLCRNCSTTGCKEFAPLAEMHFSAETFVAWLCALVFCVTNILFFLMGAIEQMYHFCELEEYLHGD